MSSITYLGENLSWNGSNNENIISRVSKATGAIAEIQSILDSVSLGIHFFKIALLLRESLFLSTLLSSCETWYGLTAANIETLEKLDRTLLTSIFGLQKTVPSIGMYLEGGCLTIGTILKLRRVNFLHYLVNLEQNTMLYKFFNVQWKYPIRNDWTAQVKKDLNDFQLPHNLDFFRGKSKEAFKLLSKSKAQNFELDRLLTLKENKSKLKSLSYNELKMQDYLNLSDMDVLTAKSVMKWRLRMAPFGENFRNGQGPASCPLACENIHIDSQSCVLQCSVTRSLFNLNTHDNFQDAYSSTWIPSDIANKIHLITKYREGLEKQNQD